MPLSLAARYGLHRVLDGHGTFPQPAWKLDADPRISDAEILVDVDRLNLDSASFRQLASEAGGDPARVAQAIVAIVAERGKLHNPATGSGGRLVGTVREAGSIVRESAAARAVFERRYAA
jgi:L-erythro-3,5-diaminohexanoate dehydrogenase